MKNYIEIELNGVHCTNSLCVEGLKGNMSELACVTSVLTLHTGKLSSETLAHKPERAQKPNKRQNVQSCYKVSDECSIHYITFTRGLKCSENAKVFPPTDTCGVIINDIILTFQSLILQ